MSRRRGGLLTLILVVGVISPGLGVRAGTGPGYISLAAGGGAADGQLATTVPFGSGTGPLWPSPSRGLMFPANDRIRSISSDGIISTIAGSHVRPPWGAAEAFPFERIGVDGPASQGIAIGAPVEDSEGNIYFADGVLHRIFRIDAATGILRLVAGTGQRGFSGDGGPARDATFSGPWNLVIDSSGALIVADAGNRRLRKIDSGGVVTTIAGNGHDGSTGDGGPATQAAIGKVFGMAVDRAGNVYVTDIGSSFRVRRIDPNGRISTVAGTGTKGFSGDGGLAMAAQLGGATGLWVDHSDGLLIADGGNSRVRRLDLASGIISTIAGSGDPRLSGEGGPAISAGIGYVEFVVEDLAGNLFIAGSYDAGAAHIRKIDTSGIIGIYGGFDSLCLDVAEDLHATNAIFHAQEDQAVDREGNLYVATGCNIWRVDAETRIVSRVAGNDTMAEYSGDGGPARNAALNQPRAVEVDPAGNVYVATSGDNRIRRIDAATGIITTIAGVGSWDLCGKPLTPGEGLGILVQLSCVLDLAVDAAGENLFFAENGRNRVGKLDLGTGIITTAAGGSPLYYRGDGGPARLAQLVDVWGIDLDPAGNLYVADAGDSRVRKVDAETQIITTIAGYGKFGEPGDGGPATSAHFSSLRDVEVSDDGIVYTVDWLGYNRIRAIDHNGIIHRIAGCGGCGSTVGINGGDGGPAMMAHLGGKEAQIAVDAEGNIYIGNPLWHLVRCIERPAL
ncbi:MAG TPA: hypothetical protein VGB64_15530 [Actinomycetota bacterium]